MIARTYPGADIPELADSQIKDIFRNLDMQFNNAMIRAGGYGIYTGVVAVTLRAVASRNHSQSLGRPRFLIFIILLLYLLAILSIYNGWAVEIAHTTLPNGESFWTAFEYNPGTPIFLALGIDAILSTILADATLIWRCWIVWGRSWRIVLVPILCTTLAVVSRGIVTYYAIFGPSVPPGALFLKTTVSWSVLYTLFILATLLWCTTLIIYR
ncbi:hypothetical protein ARMGADRAFT_1166888, partial [Armillaria gallica]